MIKAGDTVVCVDDTINEKVVGFFTNWIKKGEEYTVRRVEGSLVGVKRVLLEEVRNEPVYNSNLGGKFEPGFSINRFKSLETMYSEAEESNKDVCYN